MLQSFLHDISKDILIMFEIQKLTWKDQKMQKLGTLRKNTFTKIKNTLCKNTPRPIFYLKSIVCHFYQIFGSPQNVVQVTIRMHVYCYTAYFNIPLLAVLQLMF